MKFSTLLTLTLLLSLPTMAQKGLIKKLLSNEKDTTRKDSFLPIPVAGYSQEKGFEFGVGAIYAYYVDKSDPQNRSSNFNTTLTYSTKKSYHLSIDGDLWTKGNKFHLLGALKIKKTPFNFYGIGNHTASLDEDKLTKNEFKLLLEAEKEVANQVYTGLSLGFENYELKDLATGGIFSQINFVEKNGSNALFLGVSQSYDTRNSNNYPTKGFYARGTFQYAPSLKGSKNFSGNQIKLDVRGFTSLSDQFVLGLQAYFQAVNSTNTPFYFLPQLGNDELMRGYYTGRFRDSRLLASQAELRYRYNNRFGAVLFAGAGSVFGKDSFELKPNYGGGLRYFFDPAKGLSIRMDYGIGEKRNLEKRQSGFYISLAEAF